MIGIISDEEINKILDEYEVVYKPLPLELFGFVDDINQIIYINFLYNKYFQDITLIHEILHIYYEEKGIEKTEEELDQEAEMLLHERSIGHGMSYMSVKNAQN